MESLPPIVMECPTCGEKYLVSREPVIATDKRVLFSDCYFTDDQNWRTPGIIGCVTCELGFITQNGKVVATPNWEDFYQNWSHIKQAQPPAPGALALELRARKNMNEEIEKIIRKEFWYSANHTETGRALMDNNIKFKNYWLSSLERYEEMLDVSNIDERILKAEINRQLGRFEQCLAIIQSLQGKLPETISGEAQKGNSIVVVVK